MDLNVLKGRKRSRSPELVTACAPESDPVPAQELKRNRVVTKDPAEYDNQLSIQELEIPNKNSVGECDVANWDLKERFSITPAVSDKSFDAELLEQTSAKEMANIHRDLPLDVGNQSTLSEFISSELFKIEITNLPTPLKYPEARRLVLEKLDLKARKVKLVELNSSGSSIFATFENEDAKERALLAAHGFEYRQKKLIARPAKSQVKTYRRPQQEQDSTCSLSEADVDRMVAQSIAPLQDMKYAEQLEWKRKEIERIVASITSSIIKTNRDLKPTNVDGVLNHKIKLLVPLPLPSPIIDGYRNKNNFTIGRDPNGETMIGFRISSFRQGSVAVGSPLKVKTVPTIVLEGVQKVEHFITTVCKYEPYDPMTGEGLYRKLCLRQSGKDHMMVILTISGGVLAEEEIQEMGKRFLDYYSPPMEHGFASLLIQTTELPGQVERNTPKLIFGEPKAVEEVLGIKFDISPDAFFQVNTACAKVLFEQIISVAGIDEDTTVIDVCCGTGTLGIVSVKLGFAGEVIGIESCESAIEDAKKNVQNNLPPILQDRFHYYVGRAEHLIEAAINSAKCRKIVAIVDPPRCGLTSAVIAAIRKSTRVQKIVYVACKLEACKENFISLARPASKKYRGGPFIPERIIPVDMFPHTQDVECVVLLTRFGTAEDLTS